jgi:hypothetical protein
MPWTDDQQAEFLAKFHRDVIEPAASRLREQDVETLSVTPDDKERSYFSRRVHPDMKPEDLELDLENIDWVKEAFGEITDGPEGDILSDLYNQIVDLADRFEEMEDAEDVSPYIYVMF